MPSKYDAIRIFRCCTSNFVSWDSSNSSSHVRSAVIARPLCTQITPWPCRTTRQSLLRDDVSGTEYIKDIDRWRRTIWQTASHPASSSAGGARCTKSRAEIARDECVHRTWNFRAARGRGRGGGGSRRGSAEERARGWAATARNGGVP